MARVLWLTGFGPFAGVVDNPSAAVAKQLHGQQLAGHEVVSEVLPTSFQRAAERVAEAYARLQPRAAVHLGVARTAKEIRVEAVAANEQTASIPDVDGVLALGDRCSTRYPIGHKLSTNTDAAAIAARVRQNGLPAQRSVDAGRYVCNATYFHALHAAAQLPRQPLVVFIHLPPTGAQRTVGGATWNLADLVEATRVVLIALADNLTGRVTGPIR